MSSHSPREPDQPTLERPTPRPPGLPHRGLRTWLVERLDSLLSDALRRSSPAELTRSRILVGSALFFFSFGALYLLIMPLTLRSVPVGLAVPGYLGAVLLARRVTSLTSPALLLSTALVIGVLGTSFVLADVAPASTHAANMLIPALAVYLLGPRLALISTSVMSVTMALILPLYHTQLSPSAGQPVNELYWPMHIFAAMAAIGTWLIGSLHSAARDETQSSLERTLKDLRESEGKLHSLIESTDDLVCSLDTQGRILTANSALKQAYFRRFGQELVLGQPLSVLLPAGSSSLWEQRIAEVLGGQRLRFEETLDLGGALATLDVGLSPIIAEERRVKGLTLFARDITARRQAEVRLSEMHRNLLDASRYAGMAEIATGVLHNVGNTLNSVNISTGLIIDRLRGSRISNLSKASQLLNEHSSNLGTFLTTDPLGQFLPQYFSALSEQLHAERDALLREMHSLREGVDHIKSIVSMQQKHARAAGAVEQLSIPPLIDEALRLHAVSLERLGIHIEREYAQPPPIIVDRHKLLQILVNLLNNAQHALVESSQQDKRLTIRVRLSPEGTHLLIEVADNGVGIAPENLQRIFSQGFTTKKTGHGFGLHISSLSAMEMGGRLTCTSPGPGQGATFTLSLPLVAEEVRRPE